MDPNDMPSVVRPSPNLALKFTFESLRTSQGVEESISDGIALINGAGGRVQSLTSIVKPARSGGRTTSFTLGLDAHVPEPNIIDVVKAFTSVDGVEDAQVFAIENPDLTRKLRAATAKSALRVGKTRRRSRL